MSAFGCDNPNSACTDAHANEESSSDDQPAELPLTAYTMIARALPQSELPTLRLVSKAWCEAASAAVQKVGPGCGLTVLQVQRLPLLLERFPCLSEFDMEMTPELQAMDALQLMHRLSGLQSLTLDCSVGQSQQGLQLILQQTKLTSLCLSTFSPVCGTEDNTLRSIGFKLSLVSLDLNLSSSTTDDGISSLSTLTNLQFLRLPVSRWEAEVTGRSLSVFAALNHLTYLCLIGWPIRDNDLLDMTCLASLQHLDLSECMELTSLCFMPLLQFPSLHKLQIIRGDQWLTDSIATMFQLLKPSVELHA